MTGRLISPIDEEDRFAHCSALWRSVPAEMRLPLLLEVIERYRHGVPLSEADPGDPVAMIRSGYGTNDLIISGYRLASGRERKQLRMEPDEQQCLTILRTAFHHCGHGEDTAPPLRLALRHFRKKPYTPDFFEALRAYRAVLAQASSHTAVQGLKGEIDLLLWQDLGGSQPECWTSRFRDGVRLLPEPEKGLWLGLWHAFCYSPIPGPPRHWKTDAAIGAIGPERVKERLLEWISLPAAGTPALRMTTAGSAALKNIVWVATKVGAPALDDALHETLLSQWKNPRPLDKVAAAMCHLWNQRNERPDRQGKLHAIRKVFPV